MHSLGEIRQNKDYEILLTSWTPPFFDMKQVRSLIDEGDHYIQKIDGYVKRNYSGDEMNPLDFCKKTVTELGLPPFLVNLLVDKSFRSHLKN